MGTEETLVRTFIRRERRSRYLELLGRPKSRPKLLELLAHKAASDLDPRYSAAIPPASQNPQAILALLTAKGAPGTCRAISENAHLDGKELPLAEALAEVVGYGSGTFLSCLEGRLAYFEGEGPGERFLCLKP